MASKISIGIFQKWSNKMYTVIIRRWSDQLHVAACYPIHSHESKCNYISTQTMSSSTSQFIQCLLLLPEWLPYHSSYMYFGSYYNVFIQACVKSVCGQLLRPRICQFCLWLFILTDMRNVKPALSGA